MVYRAYYVQNNPEMASKKAELPPSSRGKERKLPIITVDAFTNKAFSGNPAAICLLNEDIAEETKMQIASEMNLSETAYLQTLGPGETFENASNLGIRWFTPTHEVDLCGHATLASAAVLFFVKGNTNEAVTFQSRSGELKAEREGDFIKLDFPLNTPAKEESGPLAELIKATIGIITPADVQYTPMANQELLLRLPDSENRETLESLKPNFQAMMASPNTSHIKGVVVTLKGSPDNGAVDTDGKQYDFISRYFAPWYGIPEDPATGSAHTVLAGYWSQQLGKKELYARQCSKRGGDIGMRVRDDNRVDLLGKAAVVLQGEITIR